MLAELEAAHPAHSEADAAELVAAFQQAAAAGEASGDEPSADAEGAGVEPMWHAIRHTMVPALTLAHLDNDAAHTARALATSRLGKPAAAMPPEHVLTRLYRGFGRARDYRGLFACLDAQSATGQDAGAEGQQVRVAGPSLFSLRLASDRARALCSNFRR